MESFQKKRIAVILGTRPELLKLAPVILEFKKYPEYCDVDVLLTGQHTDLLDGLLDLFELNSVQRLPLQYRQPNLAQLNSDLLQQIDKNFLAMNNYSAVVVQGDTTTAFAGALAAFYRRIPVAHVEAGLRTYKMDEPFPEELNRQLISKMARWHFCPTEKSKNNLLHESIMPMDIDVCGNTIIDALKLVLEQKIPSGYEKRDLKSESEALAQALEKYELRGGECLALLTLHRRENQGPELEAFFQSVRQLSFELPKLHFIYPYHLNPNVKSRALEYLSGLNNVHPIPPLSYRPMVHLMNRVDFGLSDSGGIQEEFPTMKKPLLILRNVTERPEVVEKSMGLLVGTDPQQVRKSVLELYTAKIANTPTWFTSGTNPFGDGLASERIVRRMFSDLNINLQVEIELGRQII